MYFQEKASITIRAHLDDQQNCLQEEEGAVYWATGYYQVEKLPDGKYELTYQDMWVHQEVGLAPRCKPTDPPQKSITIDNIIWSLQRDRKLNAIMTPEGEQKVIEEIKKKENEIFTPVNAN